MKKLLSILLAVMLVFSLMAPVALADGGASGTEPSGTVDPQPTGDPQPTEEPQPTGEPQPSEDPQPSEEPEVPTITVVAGNNAKTGKITLKWTAVDGAAKYEVYRSTTKTGEYKKLFTTTGLTMTNTGVTAGYAYFYKVKVLGTDGKEILTSDIVSRYADCAAPVVTAGNNAKTGKITLKWEAVSGANKYEVYRSATKDGVYKKLGSTTTTGFSNVSVNANDVYYYKVKALSLRTASANSAFSAAVVRRCDCAAPTVKAGNMAESGKVFVKWDAVDGASKYEVYRSTSKNGKYSKYYTTSKKSYIDNSTKAGYTYYYKVKAISKANSAANSAFSAVVSRICKCAMPQLELVGYDDDGTALYNVDYNNNGNLIFKWYKITGAGSYKVYRSGSANGTYKLLGETEKTSFTDKTAKAGYYYYYKIVAVSSKTSSANSAAFKIVAAPCFPQVKNLKTIKVEEGISLKWDAVKGVDGYMIMYNRRDPYDDSLHYAGETTKTSFRDKSLPKGYMYAVVAYMVRDDGIVITSVPAYVTPYT